MGVSDRQVRRWAIAAVSAIAAACEPRENSARLRTETFPENQRFAQAVSRTLGFLSAEAAERRGLAVERLGRSRLAVIARLDPGASVPGAGPELRALAAAAREASAAGQDEDLHFIAALHEALVDYELARDASGAWVVQQARGRKRSGAFFTPPALTRVVVQAALEPLRRELQDLDPAERTRRVSSWRVCDPAMGAGAFLFEVCAALAAELPPGGKSRRVVLDHCLHGVDVNPLSVAVAEVCLWLFAADPELSPETLEARLRPGDALDGDLQARQPSLFARRGAGFDWVEQFPQVFADGRGFDLVIGNPPWVAFAGRAAQPLSPEKRSDYAARFRSMRGYPTLHGMFVERAAKLAPRGSVALLVPSPIADLDGYRAVRRALTETHRPREPLTEFGQDAFASVTQPCFALIADPAPGGVGGDDRPWQLSERQRARVEAAPLEIPGALERLRNLAPLPKELFGEMGLQTSGGVSQRLLLRAAAPDDRHTYPLLEGRDVGEFRQGPPRLFLHPDPSTLEQARCRVRPVAEYQRVKFVVRQTARHPIAALHGGLPFRNTLLAGFEHPELDPALMVGLLNSSLYRALHVARQRDARQAVFPQVKIRHLRELPRPPAAPAAHERIRELTRRAGADGVDEALRVALDETVFELFAIEPAERGAIVRLLETASGNSAAR
ncbi:MAG TPA: TaqI-like C-terminal specificity domain-containing protein [Polyangiaceae bacterium]|nr:TaqI-like C-terminal specificity domain-containing protein [Polyangiaceae bacterium]